MRDFTSIENLQDATVFDVDGDKVGGVGQVYLDDDTNEPTFITVKTGLFGMKETFVPLSDAAETSDGVTVPFKKDFIKDAPNVDADGHISPEDERRVYDYYGMNYGRGGDSVDAGRDAPASKDRGDAGTDEASVVVRNEELNVGTERRATGQVRLRKHTYTDTETVEVPVTREEVVVDREPIDPDSAEARAGGGDEEIVVETHEEVPVVDKKVTAEKVSADKQTVTDTEKVSDSVQHEEVDVDRDAEGKHGKR